MPDELIVSPAGRRYGRFEPQPLPSHMMLSRVAPTLPDVVDLRPWCGPIKDQKDEPSCTGHAFSSAREWISRKVFKTSPILSPQYAYVRALMAQGSFPGGEGSDGETLCNVLIANGCCEESAFPYVPGQIIKPTPEQDVNAWRYRLGAYHGLTTSQVCLSVLGDPVPWPVEIGFTVYESFESGAVASTGVMPYPEAGENVLGGHEVLAVGYDVGAAPTIRPHTAPPSVLIQNSWGPGWGEKGWFWMPIGYLNRGDTDMKIIHSGHKWIVS